MSYPYVIIAPSYLSSAKAEICVSELRPTKVRTEALICINVFLDELLWLVLSSARSFSTERLKIGLLKALPTTLGKEALLEAEVELRAHWEKSGHALLKAIEAAPVPSSSEFPLQAAFELLRHKCEAYSTLGELDEDPEIEARLQARMAQASPNVAPNTNAVAPAALYLTAVIEHVCEHVLSNVARVVARNSSQASANVTDLYAALCEDESIYNLFRTMKVYEQIERQSKSQRPHKTRSFSRLPQDHLRSPSRVSTSSPHPAPFNSDLQLKARSSQESSIAQQYAGGLKPSMEKARGLKLFKNGNSEPNGHTPERHSRAPSVVGSIIGGQGPLSLADQASEDADDAPLQDFDDLMRSGATMKVSLTPDRLKTLEVYNKQKVLRAGAKPPSSAEGSNQPKPTLRSAASSKSLPKSFSRDRDEIPEPVPPTPTRSRSRNGSFSGVLFGGGGSSSNGSGLKRKISLTNAAPVSSLDRKQSNLTVDTTIGIPKRNRPQKGRARNRESLELDDVMDGDEDLGEKVPMTPKAPVPIATSSSTRDLIDFLAEGPPEPPPSPPRSQTPVPNEKPKGRFGRMVSRLGRGSSTEQLNHLPPPSSAGQAVALSGGAAQIQRSQTFVSTVARTPSQVKKQRSHGNLSNNGSGTSLNNIQVPLPLVPLPRPPPMPNRANSSVGPPSPSHSIEHNTTQSAPATEGKRQLSIHRKAVPQWDGDVNASSPPANSPTVDRKRPNGIVTMSSSAPVSPRENTFATPPPSARKRDTPFIPERGATVQPIAPNSITPSPIRSNSSSTSVSVSTKYILSLPATQTSDVQEMRRMVAKATSVAEAKLLVDMFLAQWGFPVVTSDAAAATERPVTVEDQYGKHGAGVIEMLLGDGMIEESVEPAHTQAKLPGPSLVITPSATSVSSPASSPAASKSPLMPPPRSPSRPPSVAPSPKPQMNSLHGMPHSPAPPPAAVMV